MNLPPTLTKERIRRCFDRARDTYVKAAMVQAGVAETCARNVPRGHYPAIIEIGAGGGVLTHRVAARCSHERYLGVDISPGMLAQIDKSDLTCPEFVAADAEHLDVAAHTFDLLVSSSTFQWYRTPERSIPDNFRLLRSGGCFFDRYFIDGTFPEITAASGATGFGSLLPLRTDAFYRDVVGALAPEKLEFARSTHVTHHASVPDLLRAHQATGATATSGQKRPSKDAYKRFVEHYEAHFRDAPGVRSTAEILHVWGRM